MCLILQDLIGLTRFKAVRGAQVLTRTSVHSPLLILFFGLIYKSSVWKYCHEVIGNILLYPDSNIDHMLVYRERGNSLCSVHIKDNSNTEALHAVVRLLIVLIPAIPMSIFPVAEILAEQILLSHRRRPHNVAAFMNRYHASESTNSFLDVHITAPHHYKLKFSSFLTRANSNSSLVGRAPCAYLWVYNRAFCSYMAGFSTY